MWSYFSRDPISNFNYDVGELVDALENVSLWRLHEGKNKTDNSRVSIFGLDVKAASETQLETGRAAVKRLKTLRHPNVVTYVDSVENANVIYVVTEYVVPLRARLEELQKNAVAVSWGIHQITKVLDFLNNSCSLVHNNVSLGAVFSDKAGEWKLGGVEFLYNQAPGTIPPVKIIPTLEKYEPPERSVAKLKKQEKWSTDMWGLGCLVWEIFNGELPRNSALKSPGKIPKNLVTNYCELVSANPCSRPNPASFIEFCRREEGFMCNSFVETMLFIEEIQIKEAEEKTRFFGTLTDTVDSFPDDVCRHKILPQLLNAYEFAGAGSAILAPLFKLSRLLSEEEYQKKIVPSVVKLFSSSDRTTRVRLLQQSEFFIEHLQVATVNDQIFPQVVHGFMDTNPTVREHTIKAMVHMASKLNYNNLNVELMKHFARLQSRDDQGGIRTNTTVCLGKIAGFMNPQMRQKVLVSAFCRALRDPFPPARQAGVLALAATHNYFSLNDVASKIIPPLALSSRDPEKSVRDQAFKAIKLFLAKLEKVSEHPEEAVEIEKDVNSGSVQQASAVASWAGWAVTSVGSLTSKIYSKSGSPSPASESSPAPEAKPKASTTETVKKQGTPTDQHITPVPPAAPQPSIPKKPEEVPSDSLPGASDAMSTNAGWDADDAWDDFGDDESRPTEDVGPGWNDFDDGGWEDFGDLSSQPDNPPAASLQLKKTPSPAARPTSASKELNSWEDDDFVPFEADVKPASSYNWGTSSDSFPVDPNSDAFFDALPVSTKPAPSLSLSKSSKSSSPNLLSANTEKQSPTVAKNISVTEKASPSVVKKKASPTVATEKASPTVGNKTPINEVSAKLTAMEVTTGGDEGSLSGWDSWGAGADDGFGDAPDKNAASKADLMKQKREQRKQEMEKKRAAKGTGVMKLGVRKVD